jgi:hypothetical protein
LTLPDDRAPPPGLFEEFDGILVTTNISKKLLHPVINVGFGNPCPFAVLVRMPEAAVHEEYRSPPWEYQVGLPLQIGAMEPEPQPQRMRRSSHVHFGCRILRFYLSHSPGSMGTIVACLFCRFGRADRQGLGQNPLPTVIGYTGDKIAEDYNEMIYAKTRRRLKSIAKPSSASG